MCKLIVHADDFGLSEKVNDGILYAHTRGILTSTSIIASGAAFDHAVGIYRSVPTLDVGVHLTLVEERPVLDPDVVQSLIDGEGRFQRHASVFIKKYLAGKISRREVRRELEAQIRKVIAQGVKVSHLDSHQHLHVLPWIWDLTIELAREYGIPAIRMPRERVRIGMLRETGSIPRVLRLFLLNGLCRLGRDAEALRTDYFFGFLFSGNLNEEYLKDVLQHLPRRGTCELMCHPGLEDPDTLYAHWGYHWSDELSALTNTEVSDFLRYRGVHLISYRQLADL